MMSETFNFQAEIKQVLHTLIHSLYSEREIFLRELISNRSDALNRMQFELLTNRDVVDPDAELAIWITPDEAANTLTITDTGIGMSRAELISNLGTISRSGIKAFMEQVKASNNQVASDLIGQFGVGFYSIFMVAEQVEVISQSYLAESTPHHWLSSGDETFEVEAIDHAPRGTSVILHLKEEAKEFLKPYRLREIIKKHSNYIAFPIYLVDLNAPEKTEDEDEEKARPKPINDQQALWRRRPTEVEEKEYHDFYRALTLDFEEPLLYSHITAEGSLQYYGVLYVPTSPERNMFSLRKEPGLKLYARKVLIQEYCTDLLPEYLQFVQGVVDSEDLPLNVSRETVQANRIMVNLKDSLTKRILRDIKRLAESEDTEKYTRFWEAFGPFIKHGIIADMENKGRLTELLRFRSTHSQGELTSLKAYVERMKSVEGQAAIYYVVADSEAVAALSPHLEPFRARNVEVLYFADTVDSFLINALHEYDGYKLLNVDDEDLDLSAIPPNTTEEETDTPPALVEEMLDTLIERFKAVLGERVADVRISKVLTSGKNPARLVSPEGTLDRHTQRVYKMLNREYEVPQKILELNPHHTLTHNLSNLLQNDADNPLVSLSIEQIYENALLLDGLHPNPADMVARIQSLLEAATHR
jgi:molecular chaperone HtpG